jgi:hypothetical protein
MTLSRPPYVVAPQEHHSPKNLAPPTSTSASSYPARAARLALFGASCAETRVPAPSRRRMLPCAPYPTPATAPTPRPCSTCPTAKFRCSGPTLGSLSPRSPLGTSSAGTASSALTPPPSHAPSHCSPLRRPHHQSRPRRGALGSRRLKRRPVPCA